jgi:sugar phosphate isomerase/epimerase
MKTSLDSIGYAGWFYEGPPLEMEECIKRAAKFGFDAVEVLPHRPVCFPMDYNKDRRKKLVDMAGELGVKFSGIGAFTVFRRSDHVLAPRQDKEIWFVKECCEMAQDLGAPVIRIFASFDGYFFPMDGARGYGNISYYGGRCLEVSQELDYLAEWHFVRKGIAECARIAADYGVVLALQNHPPITNNTVETIAMVEEINHPNLKICLDLPLFESQSTEFVHKVVRQVGKERFAHSHVIGIKGLMSCVGSYGFIETSPEDGPENWLEFFKAAYGIGYDGYFAHEQCSPVFGPGHVRAGIDEFDRRYEATNKWMKRIFADLKAGKL